MTKSKSSKELPGGCLSLFGLPFLAGGILTSWMYFSGYTSYLAAQRWDEVPCWIESAKLEVHSGEDNDTYQTVASYHYEYAGRTWHGDRVSFHSGGDNIGDFQQRTHQDLSRYVMKKSTATEATNPEDATRVFRCYVNPDKPSESVLYRTFRWQLQAFMALFALTFPAVGAGLVFGGLIGSWRKKQMTKLINKQVPGLPWNGTSALDRSIIAESGTTGKTVLGIYTFWSALVIFPLVITSISSGALAENPNAAFLFLFPLLWCIPAWFTLKHLRQYLTLGKARFEPSSFPAIPGGRLSGSILLIKPPPMRTCSKISLICRKRTTRNSGENTSTSSETIWSHEVDAPVETITHVTGGYRIPVSFTLPAGGPASGPAENGNIEYVWEVNYKVPGTVINSTFTVPVSRKDGTPPQRSVDHSISILNQTSTDLPALLSAKRIQAEFATDGTPVSIVCPAGRNRMMIGFLLFFNIIWTGAAIFLIRQHAPLIFRVVWPVSATAIWLAILWQILHKRSVTMSPTGLELRNQLGPFIHTRIFEKSQILGFSHDTNMSSNNTSFYRVRLESVFGKKATLVDNITESNTAEVLAKRLDAWKNSK